MFCAGHRSQIEPARDDGGFSELVRQGLSGDHGEARCWERPLTAENSTRRSLSPVEASQSPGSATVCVWPRSVLEQWYAATFHWAWLLIARPDDADAYARLHAAHANWLALRTADRAAQTPAPPAPPGEEHHLALITELAASLVGRTILSVLNTTRTGLSVLLADSAIKASIASSHVSHLSGFSSGQAEGLS